MKLTKQGSSGSTLVEIMIVAAIIGLLAAIALPNFIRSRITSRANVCIHNLRQIDNVTQQWAVAHDKRDSAEAVPNEVAGYIRGGAIPIRPTGSVYVFSVSVSATPSVTCPIGSTETPSPTLPSSDTTPIQ